MVDKNPSSLAAILTPVNREAGAHFVDAGNSRYAQVRDLMEWVTIEVWLHSGGDVAAVDFIDLDNYADLMIIARDVTKSVSGTINLQVSNDNGSSFHTTSGDYVSFSTAGAATNLTSIPLHATNATAARSALARISNFNGLDYKAVEALSHTIVANIITEQLAMNAIRILPSGGGNFTGGSITLLGR